MLDIYYISDPHDCLIFVIGPFIILFIFGIVVGIVGCVIDESYKFATLGIISNIAGWVIFFMVISLNSAWMTNCVIGFLFWEDKSAIMSSVKNGYASIVKSFRVYELHA